MHGRKSLHYDLGRGRAGQKVDVASLHECVQHLDDQTVHMSKRQHAYGTVAGLVKMDVVETEPYVRPYVAV